MTVKEIIELKLSERDVASPFIPIAILETEQAIKNYCSINSIPPALTFVWANMAVDLIRYQVESTLDISNLDQTIEPSAITQLKIGDTSVSTQGGAGMNERAKAIKSHLPKLDELVMSYKEQLNAYRRMVW